MVLEDKQLRVANYDARSYVALFYFIYYIYLLYYDAGFGAKSNIDRKTSKVWHQYNIHPIETLVYYS